MFLPHEQSILGLDLMLSNLSLNNCVIFYRGENIINLVNSMCSLSHAVFLVVLTSLTKKRVLRRNDGVI